MVFITVKKRYDEMPSIVEAVPKAKMVMFHFMFVHYTFRSLWVADWPPFGKWLPARLNISSHCIWSICNIYLFPVLVLRADLPFDCSSSCSLLFYYFYHVLSCHKR